jgi:glycosyltransferase involved in cell wall biosynthesis
VRIAQIAPLAESVPPGGYGGTERVVSYLTEQLVEDGHEVTLFATGDSTTTARLVAALPRAIRLDPNVVDHLAPHLVMLERVFRQADDFDVLHFHVDYLHYPLSRREGARTVTTLHGRLDIPELAALYHEFSEIPVVSISDSQRRPIPRANWRATVYHGLPADLYRLHERPGDYLAFLGRISPEKGADTAIAIATRAGVPLRIAAKVDEVDADYYERTVRPLLERSEVEFVGEIGGAEKEAFLGNALALLFPIQWPEPFGLVMIEAMACGTPVIAYRHGSVPEVMRDGVTGYIVEDADHAVAAIARLRELSRARCREVFEQRFTVRQMVDAYLEVYRRLPA